MNKKLKKLKSKKDWKVTQVVVIYPTVTSNDGTKAPIRPAMKGHYHGRLLSNHNHCIVEDENGWIHVVHKDIVFYHE